MPEYRNPQQESGGGGQSRMTLVLVVTFALILIGQFVLIKNKAKNPPPKTSTPTAAEQSPAPAAATQPEQAPESPKTKSPKATGKTATLTEHKAATGEIETVVENDLYRIVFTNKGAQAKSWVLKKYKDEKRQPLDLVSSAATDYGYPLALYTYDDKLRDQLNSALYVGSGDATDHRSWRADVRILRWRSYRPQDLPLR